MKAVVLNTTGSTVTLPPVFTNYPLPAGADKQFSYASMPAADLASLVGLVKAGKISFPGSNGLGTLPGLPVTQSPMLTYVVNGQEPVGAQAGVDGYWSVQDNAPRQYNGSVWFSSVKMNSTLLSAEQWMFGPKSLAGHAAVPRVKLLDGRVLVCSGSTSHFFNAQTNKCEIYDPATNTITRVADFPGMSTAGCQHLVLLDGRVLRVGGVRSTSFPTFHLSNEAWIYDPIANTWTRVADLPLYGAIAGSPGVVFPVGNAKAGKALILGGVFATADVDITTQGPNDSRHAYLYNPTLNTWAATGDMIQGHIGGAGALLPDGRYAVVGGRTKAPGFFIDGTSNKIDVYDPSAGTWTAYTMPAVSGEADNTAGERISANCIMLTNGNLLIVGGLYFNTANANAIDGRKSSIIFQPDTNTFLTDRGPSSNSNNVDMPIARSEFGIERLDSNRVFICGGDDDMYFPTVRCAYYNEDTDTFDEAPSLPAKRIDKTTGVAFGEWNSFEASAFRQAVALQNGNVLFWPSLKGDPGPSGNKDTYIFVVNGNSDVRLSAATTFDAPTVAANRALHPVDYL